MADKLSFCKQLQIVDVCRDIAGIEYTGKNMESPFRQGSGKNAFTIDPRKNMFADWGYPVDDNPRGFASGDPIDFVYYYYGCTRKEAVDILWKRYNGGNVNVESSKKKTSYTPPERKEAPTLSKDKLNLAYNAFLSFATLEKKGSRYLQETRKMTDDEIRYFGFKSFPQYSVRHDLTTVLCAQGIDPDSIPGLFTKKGENDVSFRRRDALLIPVFSVYGQIEGIQMRFYEPKDGPRYIWFSSEKMSTDTCIHDGKSPGTPIGFVDRIKKTDRTLFITEGMFKAIAINKCYGCPVFSVQGVGNYHGIEEQVQVALERYPHINRILIAYDADFIGNISVSSHAIKLFNLLLKSFPDLKYQYVLWNEKYGKGFDDLIENTGGWDVKSIVRTINMVQFEAAHNNILPQCKQLMFDGNRDAIKVLMKSELLKYIRK